MPRRANSRVTVSHTQPPAPKQESRSKAMPLDMLPSYSFEGADSLSTARALYRAGVLPKDIDEWEKSGVAHRAYDSMIYLSESGVIPSDLTDYPSMHYSRLISLKNAGVTADTAHAYGHALGWCCGRLGNSSYAYADWTRIPGWEQYSCTPVFALSVLDRGYSADAVSDLLVLRSTPKLLDHLSQITLNERGVHMAIRETWLEWVKAAEGHVAIAKAVCEGGGSLETVGEWLLTGEEPARIISLARTGIHPSTLESRPGLDEFTDDDIEVWVMLNDPSIWGTN